MSTLESFVELHGARAGFRALASEWIAGGPALVELEIAPGAAPLAIASGVDRQSGRPAFVQVRAQTRGVALADPFPAPSMGGIAGVQIVAPGDRFRQTVIVNQFARLEELWARLAPGESCELELACARPLPAASTREAALATAGAPLVEARLVIPVRRDDAALAAAVDALAAIVRARWTPATSPELETALGELVALRLPDADAALAALADHPNALVRARATAAKP